MAGKQGKAIVGNCLNGNQFRDDEISILDQLRDGRMVKNIFPKSEDGSGSLMRRMTSCPSRRSSNTMRTLQW